MSSPDPVHDGGPPSYPRQPGTIKLGTVAGSDVLVAPSWFLIAIMIAVVVAPRVDQVEPGLGALKYVAGLAFAIILWGSVLLHEAAHAYAAKHYGYPVGPIVLHFLGGATAIEGEARRPKHEFWIAVVGPLTSLLVGGVALAAIMLLHTGGLIEMALESLVGANFFVGVLNLVPGLPLDGGRVMKALVWGISRSAHRGTLVAGWIGRVAAGCALVWPWVQGPITGIQPGIFDVVIYVTVALFLWSGASAAMASASFRAKLPRLVARDLARRTLAVPADLPLAEAVRRAQDVHAGSIVTMTGAGHPTGIVSEAALLATPEDRRPWLPTSTVARSLETGLSLPVDLAGEALVLALTRTPAAEYLLVEPDGSIYGVLATADVDEAFKRAGR